MNKIIFLDLEVSESGDKVFDYGAIKSRDEMLHTGSYHAFNEFIAEADYLCGHNIINHDSKYFEAPQKVRYIDTLYLSPLLFPNKPYHALLKDDKLQTDELNNPLNDAIKAQELFYDEINAFESLGLEMRQILYLLLHESPYFSGFFEYLSFHAKDDPIMLIRCFFLDKICENAPLSSIIAQSPVELAYALAMISATEKYSILPRWVLMQFPKTSYILRLLLNTPCMQCHYCNERLNPVNYLRKYFGYSAFRAYNGEPLQEKAVHAAVNHRSLLAIFPTGGGKSLTFQIPALMAGETEKALTVIISPLQSLMKDQVDNLEKRGIAEAVTINGLLSPIERAEAMERVESGIATLLYISPESLRSATIERLFMSRHIDRFVIDEAHCFSAWGQDFRVDYLYIGDFIRELQEKKGNGCRIPVSCFTATAKQKVISDIKEYFKNKLDIELELYATNASRTNLRYEVLYKETDAEKYDTLRSLIEQKNCPTIVYVSRTKRTLDLAEKLTRDGFEARAFNGKMDSREKQENQEAFINDEVQVMVATSAFGMGVDKSNVRLVIHYDISDSLENYVQEAGRAGRDQSLDAECYVLFNDNDLDKHFILLNQTKLSISEIQQIWKAVKDLTKTRRGVCCSPLEVARQAGWDDSISDIETRVKTAIQALENAGYIKRGKNSPRIYATSILVKNMMEASARIDSSCRFQDDNERLLAKRILQSLISSKSISKAGNADAESRIDYLADRLGAKKEAVIHSIQIMREENLIADTKDITAYIQKTDTLNRSMLVLRRYTVLEEYLLDILQKSGNRALNYKELNEGALSNGIKTSSVNAIKTLFFYWRIRDYILEELDQSSDSVVVIPKFDIDKIRNKRRNSYDVSKYIIDYLFHNSGAASDGKEEVLVGFSILELLSGYRQQSVIGITEYDVEEALLFLSKINALKLEGGFLVLYSAMHLQRMVLDNKIRYKIEDYKQLNDYYQQKMQQIHIVGEYANMMVRDYNAALQFVNDYFMMDYKKFLALYFSGERAKEIERNITPGKYKQLFDTLSSKQLDIINDNTSKHIVVAAGPGSGKTRVLVHKLASLLLLEDVKQEQLLMLTFSRAAATEFKLRLRELIGNAAHFVQINTFHSYCFDLLGKIGNIQESGNVVKSAVELLRSGDVDLGKITKTVLVIDEAQDMDGDEYGLVEALMERNDDMRVIAVGDDDQNIFQFRGSDSAYMKSLMNVHDAKLYSLVQNYRSTKSIVSFSNRFVKSISDRMKSEDIQAVADESGEVVLIKHYDENLEIPLVQDMLSRNLQGSTCILTSTNEEALLILGVLRRKGKQTKLIQANEGFDLYNLAEIRYFLKKLPDRSSSPLISKEQWEFAMCAMEEKYQNSTCLPMAKKILETFDSLNERKYYTDLECFLHESGLEDFYTSEQGVITISTMHKAKGREFDHVFILLKKIDMRSDEEKRKLYVAMTRAKKQLNIHYYGNALDSFQSYASEYRKDLNQYHKPEELILQLSHKDVYLDYFKDKKRLIAGLQSGEHLALHGNRLYVLRQGKAIPVLQFSKKGTETVNQLVISGYKPYDAVIRFVCGWKGKEDTEEAVILLADVFLNHKS